MKHTNEFIRDKLFELKDEKYKAFHTALVPDTSREIIGVRLPLLREIAKEIARDDAKEYLSQPAGEYYEEVMLRGLTIGYMKCDLPTLTQHIRDFLPLVDNWAICDSFSSGLKVFKKHKEEALALLLECAKSDSAYTVRFAIVMLLDYFCEEKYVPLAFDVFDVTDTHGYYVSMAVAWAVSGFFVRFPKETEKYLASNLLDDVTYNRALRKICESNVPDAETKKKIKALKRV